MAVLSVLRAEADHWLLQHAKPGLPGIQEKVDLDTSVDAVKRKMIDAAGGLWGGKSVRYYLCLLHRIVQMQLTPLTDNNNCRAATFEPSCSRVMQNWAEVNIAITCPWCCRTHQLLMQSQMTSKICWGELCSKPCSSGCKSLALFTCCLQASSSQLAQYVGCLQPNVAVAAFGLT